MSCVNVCRLYDVNYAWREACDLIPALRSLEKSSLAHLLEQVRHCGTGRNVDASHLRDPRIDPELGFLRVAYPSVCLPLTSQKHASWWTSMADSPVDGLASQQSVFLSPLQALPGLLTRPPHDTYVQQCGRIVLDL